MNHRFILNFKNEKITCKSKKYAFPLLRMTCRQTNNFKFCSLHLLCTKQYFVEHLVVQHTWVDQVHMFHDEKFLYGDFRFLFE